MLPRDGDDAIDEVDVEGDGGLVRFCLTVSLAYQTPQPFDLLWGPHW